MIGGNDSLIRRAGLMSVLFMLSARRDPPSVQLEVVCWLVVVIVWYGSPEGVREDAPTFYPLPFPFPFSSSWSFSWASLAALPFHLPEVGLVWFRWSLSSSLVSSRLPSLPCSVLPYENDTEYYSAHHQKLHTGRIFFVSENLIASTRSLLAIPGSAWPSRPTLSSQNSNWKKGQVRGERSRREYILI